MKLDKRLHSYRLRSDKDVMAQHDRREGKGWKVLRVGFDPKSEWTDDSLIISFDVVRELAALCDKIERPWKRKGKRK